MLGRELRVRGVLTNELNLLFHPISLLCLDSYHKILGKFPATLQNITYGKYHSLSDLSSVEFLLNKLRFAMSNLTSQTQNIEASRSRIQGADFAADVANLAKNQILVQAAISQNILSFLR